MPSLLSLLQPFRIGKVQGWHHLTVTNRVRKSVVFTSADDAMMDFQPPGPGRDMPMSGMRRSGPITLVQTLSQGLGVIWTQLGRLINFPLFLSFQI